MTDRRVWGAVWSDTDADAQEPDWQPGWTRDEVEEMIEYVQKCEPGVLGVLVSRPTTQWEIA